MLTNYDGKYIVYDAIGNPLADGTWSYTWEQGRKLTRMQGSVGTWNYTYNSDGMRISRSNGSNSYTYWYDSDGKLLRMKYNDVVMSFSYSASGQPMSIAYNGVVYYYLVNAQGDVVGLIDSTGVAVVQYTYDAWGRLLSTSGTAASTLGINNPLRYRSYIYDRETGLYYLQSRYYNPTIGRFINADSFASTGQGVTGANMFAYCGNNPVCRDDATGRLWLIGSIIRVIKSAVTIYNCVSNRAKPTVKGYINDQEASPVADYRLGFASVAHGGCGPVAIHNALVTLGQNPSFRDVVNYFNGIDMSRLCAFGLLGTLPHEIVSFFEKKGCSVVTTDDLDEIDAHSQTADACILWYWYNNDGNVGAHYVEYHRENGQYVGHNTNGYEGVSYFSSPSEYAYKDSRFYAVGIFIYDD